MKHYGDITKINGAELPVVDIITGGSPCQDLSVAGKRAGLAGERSGLFKEQIRIIKEMRDHDRANRRADEHIRPRYMVWENVPGAFSSNKGEDFRAVLEETAKVAKGDASIPGFEGGRWPNAGCIMGNGWSIAWRVHDAQFWGVPQRRKRIALVADFGGYTAPEILFERKSMSGDLAESGKEGQKIAGNAGAGAEKTSGAISFQERAANDMYVVQSNWDGSQVAPTLTSNNANGAQRMPDKDNFTAVLTYGLDRASFNQGKNAQFNFSVDKEKVGALVAKGPGGVFQAVVRRLTPMECERLQGFPDGWTDIGEWVDSKGKKHKDSDSPRYKALGNSIALPFWTWMAGRMVRNLPGTPTMGSLFDGIGGFPFAFSGWGCEPVWASEIEGFPIAVTKRRFPDA